MHYSLAQSPRRMNIWSRAAASSLSKLVKQNNFLPRLLYRGYSGSATATALACAIAALPEKKQFDFRMTYLRKSNENSHSSCKYETALVELEANPDVLTRTEIIVFVDDFIETGSTIITMGKDWQEYTMIPLNMERCYILISGTYDKDDAYYRTNGRVRPISDIEDSGMMEKTPQGFYEEFAAEMQMQMQELLASV